MKREDLNYLHYYEHWHTPETRERDIADAARYLQQHNFYPSALDAPTLEIGCATGNLLAALQRAGYSQCQGIDIDHHQISICRQHGLNATQSDAGTFLRNNTQTFDTIYFLDVLEHLDKAEHIEVLQQLFRSLNANGKLLISVPNAMAPLGHYFEQGDWTHYCAFTYTSLNFVLKNAGFAHMAFRPSHKQTRRIRKLKQPWIKLLEAEFHLENPIVTPSILIACFNSPDALNSYLATTPTLMDYPQPLIKRLRKALRPVKRLARHMLKGKA